MPVLVFYFIKYVSIFRGWLACAVVICNEMLLFYGTVRLCYIIFSMSQSFTISMLFSYFVAFVRLSRCWSFRALQQLIIILSRSISLNMSRAVY